MRFQLHYLKQAVFSKFLNMRIYTLLVVQAFLIYLFMRPIIIFSITAGYKITPWTFPFLVSDIHFLFLFMLGIVYYFSDVPYMQYQNMYQLIRVGRQRWAIGQIGAIIIQSFIIVTFDFAISILILKNNCEFNLEWGKVLHTLALTNASSYYHFEFQILYDTMIIYSPIELIGLTIIIGGVVISFLGLTMFAMSLLVHRIAAIIVAGIMIVMPFFVDNIYPLAAKSLAMFSPVEWMRVANIGVKEHYNYILPSLKYILMVLPIGIIILSIIIIWKIGNVEFQWNKED